MNVLDFHVICASTAGFDTPLEKHSGLLNPPLSAKIISLENTHHEENIIDPGFAFGGGAHSVWSGPYNGSHPNGPA